MKDTIECSWNYGRGHMMIVITKFFPTSKTRIDKLKKIIDMDYDRREQCWVDIRECLKEYIPELKEEARKEAHNYQHYHEEVTWLSNRLKDKTSPQGVKLTKKQLDEYREKKKRFNEIARNAKAEFNRIQKHIERIEQNLEYITDFE